MRRIRISERMKKLQELFPDMDKVIILSPPHKSFIHRTVLISKHSSLQQTSTADMLELAIEYIKGLQRQVKVAS